MTLIVNAGSGAVPASGEGWTNTEETARRTAEEWLSNMHAEGMRDVELLPGCAEADGRWRFTFHHTVTGMAVCLETHGIAPMEAYERERTFHPRISWNGSSSANPDLSDFAADGFEPVKSYRAVEGRDGTEKVA